MKGLVKTYVVSLAAWSLLVLPGQAAAGMVEFEFGTAEFSNPTWVNNDYWPLSTLSSPVVYMSESDDGCEVNQMIISGATRDGFGEPYNGITAIVVEDREWVDEECTGDYVLAEATEDWFAQDDAGNIWYFGEDTTAWDDDNECLTSAGSWEAGNEAEAGVVILGSPAVGVSYQQEFYEGEAEDRAKVLRLDAPVSIDLDDYEGCMKTKEYTPLSPGDVEHKFYCPVGTGFPGLVLINELKGKTRRVEYIGVDLPGNPADFPSDFPTTDVCEE